METCAGSENLQCHSSQPPPISHTIVSSQSLIDHNNTSTSHALTLTVYHPTVVPVDTLNLKTAQLVEVPVAVAVAHTHHTHTLEGATPDIQSNKGILSSRSWEDGYNWRKYGQKHIKGSQFPRSYYKCSHPNCQMKKQLEQSHDGRITDIIYRGKHDHPKPQPVNHLSASAIPSIQGDTSKDNSDVSGGLQLSRDRDEIHDGSNNPESKRRCLNLTSEMISESGSCGGQRHEPLEAHHGQSQAFVFSSSNKMTRADASHEMSASTIAANPPSDMLISSKAILPVELECDDSQKTHGVNGVQAVQTENKGTYTSGAADRFWGDGYNWRKYGQKHIKGSGFPRSYYRCTHPNCQVKKQLECSHDGQITDIVYKGEHNHPKPQPSSHIAVGKILSIQEEGFENKSALDHHDKSLNRQTNHHTELNSNPERCAVQTSHTDVQGEGSKLIKTDEVEHNTDLDPKSNHLNVSTETSEDAATGLIHQQCKPFQGQYESQTLVSSPSIKYKDSAVSRELIPSTVSTSPVYMVTSRGIVPVEVETEDKRQRQISGNEVEVEESTQCGLSLSMTEKLLENAYHWRKYGQKNIKGSEFPRSYYRCTHPNCHVKMQLERSYDGRIIEIIYKGKHDHPKPQPITRMAIGAILSLEEDGFDKISERSGEKLNQSLKEIEDDNDRDYKRRKKEVGDMDVTPLIRSPREPRVVVETLSEVDVVDDGYRWQKYGRKIVKGNSYPRNYYRCSIGGCSVKKHVERAASNPNRVITTYEGKHNHDLLPQGRIIPHETARLVSNVHDTLGSRSDESVANGIDDAASATATANRVHVRNEILDVEPIQCEYNITDRDHKVAEPTSAVGHNGVAKDNADEDKLIKTDVGDLKL